MKLESSLKYSAFHEEAVPEAKLSLEREQSIYTEYLFYLSLQNTYLSTLKQDLH